MRRDLEILIWLLATNLKLGDRDDITFYKREIMRAVDKKDLHNWINRIHDPDHYLFDDSELALALTRSSHIPEFGAEDEK
jgi:hypothetical protein